jgi:hypothetical protein
VSCKDAGGRRVDGSMSARRSPFLAEAREMRRQKYKPISDASLPGKIRLACWDCDIELSFIASIPDGWRDVSEEQTFAEATSGMPVWEIAKALDPTVEFDPFEMAGAGRVEIEDSDVWTWWTHIGVCPVCWSRRPEKQQQLNFTEDDQC